MEQTSAEDSWKPFATTDVGEWNFAVHAYTTLQFVTFEAAQAEYGIDRSDPIPDIEADHTVVVEDLPNLLNATQSQYLS